MNDLYLYLLIEFKRLKITIFKKNKYPYTIPYVIRYLVGVCKTFTLLIFSTISSHADLFPLSIIFILFVANQYACN